MRIIADLHTHTLASNHAFSTLGEMTAQATKMGYKAMAVTDHGPDMPDAPHRWYFSNLVRLPDILEDGLLLLSGAEVNILDAAANLDLPERKLGQLDWAIASMHLSLLEPMEYDEVTAVWLKIADNPLIDMIGHSEQPPFPYDYDRVTRVFAEKNKVVEMNAASSNSRPGGEDNMRRLALCCKKNGTKIAVNSDAHGIYWMDTLGPILQMLEDIDFPEELVVNSSMERLLEELRLHGRDIARRVDGKI